MKPKISIERIARNELFDLDLCIITIDGVKYKAKAYGGCRLKVITPEYVIKLEDHIGQSSREIYFWYEVLHSKDRKYFAPIIDYGLNPVPYIVQKKLKFRPGKISRVHLNIVEELVLKYGLTDLGCHSEEYSSMLNNWAIEADTNQPVIFDYAI